MASIRLGLFAVAFCLLGAASAPTEKLPPALENVRLESFAPLAGHAVFRLPNGKLELVEKGHPLTETGAVLTEVRSDRVVLVVADDSRRLAIWMYPAEDPSKPGRVRVLSWELPEDSYPAKPSGKEMSVEAQPRPPFL